MKMSKRVMIYDYLHNTLNMSTSEIAATLHCKKNTVIASLRRHQLLKKNSGYEIETSVMEWLIKQGCNVIRQRGDAPYDLLVDGVRVDVKSSHVTTDGSYKFEVQHKGTKPKNCSEKLDAFYCVFLNEPGVPIYQIASQDVKGRYISVKAKRLQKRGFSLVGYLESKPATGRFLPNLSLGVLQYHRL